MKLLRLTLGVATAALICGANLSVSAASLSELTKSCDECHGKDGVTKEAEVPSIAGASAAYIKDTMDAFKSGKRKGVEFEHDGKKSDMNKVAKKLSDADIKALADHYAKKEYIAFNNKTDSKLVKKGKKIWKRKCKKCHGENGMDPEDDAGIIGGQPLKYIQESMEHFIEKSRPMPKKMRKKFKKLKEKDRVAVSHFFASQK